MLSVEAIRARAIPLHGIAFIGDANDESEGIIIEMGQVKRLGRLPLIEPLTREHVWRPSSPPDFRRGGFRVSSPVWHPFTQHALTPDATLVTRGEGAWLETENGRASSTPSRPGG